MPYIVWRKIYDFSTRVRVCVSVRIFFSLAISLLDNNNLSVPRNVSGGGVCSLFTSRKIVIHRNSDRQFKLDEREKQKIKETKTENKTQNETKRSEMESGMKNEKKATTTTIH